MSKTYALGTDFEKSPKTESPWPRPLYTKTGFCSQPSATRHTLGVLNWLNQWQKPMHWLLIIGLSSLPWPLAAKLLSNAKIFLQHPPVS